jgi:type IV secretion system protein TrbG
MEILFIDNALVINTRFGQTTDIALEPGETVTDIAMGDSRYKAWAEASGDPSNPIAHIVVEPEADGLPNGSLTIYSTRQVIYCELRTHNPAMREVVLYYPEDILNQMAAADHAALTSDNRTDEASSALPDTDPSHLNSAYTISGAHLPWTPERVFDNGTHVYLQMPPRIQTASAPALLLDSGGGRQMVNYRVVPNSDGSVYYVVDRLFDKAELLSGVGRKQDIVTITYAGAER